MVAPSGLIVYPHRVTDARIQSNPMSISYLWLDLGNQKGQDSANRPCAARPHGSSPSGFASNQTQWQHLCVEFAGEIDSDRLGAIFTTVHNDAELNHAKVPRLSATFALINWLVWRSPCLSTATRCSCPPESCSGQRGAIRRTRPGSGSRRI